MGNWSTRLPNLASVLLVVFIVCLPVTLSESMMDSDRLGRYLPAKWRVISPTFQPPQIEIRLLKDHVSEDQSLRSKIEYIFSNNDNRMPGIVAEVEGPPTGNEVGKGKKKSGLDSRTIFHIPKFACPPGHKKDHMGICREVFQLN